MHESHIRSEAERYQWVRKFLIIDALAVLDVHDFEELFRELHVLPLLVLGLRAQAVLSQVVHLIEIPQVLFLFVAHQIIQGLGCLLLLNNAQF